MMNPPLTLPEACRAALNIMVVDDMRGLEAGADDISLATVDLRQGSHA
jgi:hypothetical protein